MSLRNKTKDGRDETDGEKGCNRLRPTRMAQNYYGLKTKNQISSFVDHGQFEYACTQTMTHNHTHTHMHTHTNKPLEALLFTYAFFATKYQIAARNYSECNNHHVI